MVKGNSSLGLGGHLGRNSYSRVCMQGPVYSPGRQSLAHAAQARLKDAADLGACC